MPRFRYTALTAAGAGTSGRIEADSEAAAIANLQLQGFLPISATPEAAGRRAAEPVRAKLLPARELILISRQLARLLQAGLPLDRALPLIAGLMRTAAGRAAVAGTLAAVRDGSGLAGAMAAQAAFPKLFIAMVRAGERGAALPGVLTRLADFQARMEALRQGVVSALIYPVLLTAVAMVSVGLVLTVVLPQFAPLFQEAGARLPWITRAVMAAGAVVSATWWMVPPAVLAAAVLWRAALRRPDVARAADALKLRLPLAGTLLMGFDAARFARTLGTLIANGITAAAALPLAADAVGNRELAAALHAAAARLREGEGLSGPLERTGRFPELLTQLIRVGEETGRLPELLSEAAEVLETDAQRLADRMLAILVPALTLGMGAVIGVIVAAMFLAMLTINDLAL
jgi:general secretion pathway protein F